MSAPDTGSAPCTWKLGGKTTPSVVVGKGLGISSSVITSPSSVSSSINVCLETSHIVIFSTNCGLIILPPTFAFLFPFRGNRPSSCKAPTPEYVNPAAHFDEHGFSFIFIPQRMQRIAYHVPRGMALGRFHLRMSAFVSLFLQ